MSKTPPKQVIEALENITTLFDNHAMPQGYAGDIQIICNYILGERLHDRTAEINIDTIIKKGPKYVSKCGACGGVFYHQNKPDASETIPCFYCPTVNIFIR